MIFIFNVTSAFNTREAIIVTIIIIAIIIINMIFIIITIKELSKISLLQFCCHFLVSQALLLPFTITIIIHTYKGFRKKQSTRHWHEKQL